MAWIWLILAGVFEIGWAIGLKYTDGFSKLIPSLLTITLMIASFFLLSIAVKEIPIGTGYAIWTGIGAIGVAIAGMILFQESRDILRLICIGLIIIGVLGLKWAEG
jgi:quaternary ammonium compound-resistance protein SugE